MEPADPDGRPPWNPIGEQGEPACSSNGKIATHSKVTPEFFNGLWPAFCDEVDKNKDKALDKTMTKDDYKKPFRKRYESLQERSPPIIPSKMTLLDGYSFHFSWTGAIWADEGKECWRDCDRSFKMMQEGTCKTICLYHLYRPHKLTDPIIK